MKHTYIKTIEVNFEIRPWMKYALEGEKINAVKSLREDAGLDNAGNLLSLKQAKEIVEVFLS